MDNFESLLSELSNIFNKNTMLAGQARIRGEYFNIFNVLVISQKREHQNSSFICELLNKEGTHGLKDRFFREFIKIVIQPILNKNNPEISLDGDFNIHNEFPIGPIQGEEGGRLDILIENKSNAIIIENKIYAEDQDSQLLRYFNFGKKKYKNKFLLLYLTLEGEYASETSTKGKDFPYFRISYRNDISNWLERCIEISSLYPQVREVLRQYLNHLNYILGISKMSETNDDLINTLLNNKNIESTIKLLSLKDEIIPKIIKQFVEKIKVYFEKDAKFKNNKWVIDTSDISNFSHLKSESRINFYQKNDEAFTFSLEIESKWVDYGIRLNNHKEKNPQNKTIKNSFSWEEGPTAKWPFGWGYIDQGQWCSENVLLDISKDNIEESEIFQIIKNNLYMVIENYDSITKDIENLNSPNSK